MQPRKPAQSVLRQFSPLDELSDANLAALESRTELLTYRRGERLFQDDASRGRVFYLVSGAVELHVQEELADTVQANSPRARFPLKHGNARSGTARVISAQAECLSIDAKHLDKILTWDQTGSYLVRELKPAGQDERTAGDWMVRLLQAPLLHKLPPAHLQRFFTRMRPVEFRAGEIIINQNQPPDYFYVVATGTCRVTRRPALGERDVVLAELGPGDIFGADAIVGETRRNASVTMTTGGTLMRLDKADFDDLCKRPAISEMSRSEAQRLVAAGGQLVDVKFESEVSFEAIPGAINVPLYTLRESLSALRKVPTIVCCDAGQRSSVAAFILAEHGFEVHVLRNESMLPED